MGSRNNLFVYGTLQFPEVMATVLGNVLPGEPATLEDYQCLRIQGAQYPGIKYQRGAKTFGSLHRDLTRAELSRLDTYEGPLYVRVRVTVLTGNGKRSPALVYVIHGNYHHRLTREPWNVEKFMERGLDRFLSSLY